MLQLFAPDEIAGWDHRVRAAYEYWLSIHPKEGGLPGRQHMDPLHIPALLPHIWLVDVSRAPLRFKFRLFGTAHVLAMERDYTGYWIDEAFPEFETSATYQDYVDLAEQAKVSYRKGAAMYHVPRHKHLERVMLPLATDGRKTNMIMALTVYT